MAAETFIKTDATIFFDKSIKRTCKAIHSLALDLSKIPGWIIRKQYIADRLGVSLRTVNRYFAVLAKRGLAYYDEVKHRWYVFRRPKHNKTATSIGRGEPNLVEGGEPNLEGINKKDNYPEEKTTTPEPIILPEPEPIPENPVVVFLGEVFEPMPDSDPAHEPEIVSQPAPTAPCEEENPEQSDQNEPSANQAPVEEETQVALKYPEELTPKQKADIKHHIKKAPIEHRQAILSTLAHYLALGTIRTPIGWVRSRAEEAAKTGEFTPVGAASATITYNPDNDPTQALLKRWRADPTPTKEKAKVGFKQAKLALRGLL